MKNTLGVVKTYRRAGRKANVDDLDIRTAVSVDSLFRSKLPSNNEKRRVSALDFALSYLLVSVCLSMVPIYFCLMTCACC